jgi:hypothetical protein
VKTGSYADYSSLPEMALVVTTRVTTGSGGVSMMWSMYQDTGYRLLKLRQRSLSIVSDPSTPRQSASEQILTQYVSRLSG